MNFPFRLGATSYIIPADLLPNVRYLAGKARDVELILFDLEDGQSNLPTPQQAAELHSFALNNDITYTVHLPLDLRMHADGSSAHISLEKARRVIDCTQALDPWAYVAHLDGRDILPAAAPDALCRWQDQAVRALELVAGWVGQPHKLALENLEGYPLDLNYPILERVAVSRTVDVGHLWLDRHDALAYLRAALPRTRVVHIHGLGERDHGSLAQTPKADLAAVINELIASDYSGVVTIEVFSEPDFLSSMQAIENLFV